MSFFCGFRLGFLKGVLEKRVFCCGVLVVSLWSIAWLMWSLNSHILGGERYANFPNFIFRVCDGWLSFYFVRMERMLSRRAFGRLMTATVAAGGDGTR